MQSRRCASGPETSPKLLVGVLGLRPGAHKASGESSLRGFPYRATGRVFIRLGKFDIQDLERWRFLDPALPILEFP